MTAPAAAAPTAGHGLHPSFSPLPSTARLPRERRGRLRNGAEPGDFLAAPRCGSRTRAGGCCRQPAMRNGRCRLHGGLSTGPRTAEGRARCAHARRIHGFYSAEMIALRRAAAAHCRRMDGLFAAVRVRRTAGHGLLPPNLASRAGGEARISPAGAPAAPGPTSSASPRLRGGSPGGRGTRPAGHGVHRSVSIARLSPRAAHLLAGTSLRAPFSAGHEVLPSFSPSGPVPTGMMGQPARRFVAAGVHW
jgi:hypothetical protein